METVLKVNEKGLFDGEEVFYGPLSKNNQRDESQESVWVVNNKSVDKKNPVCIALQVDLARQLVNRKGRKFSYATADQIPYTPEEKIFPVDSSKTVDGQEKTNTTLKGLQIEKMAKEKKDPLGNITYAMLKEIAKANDIKVFGKKKYQLMLELKDLGLLENVSQED